MGLLGGMGGGGGQKQDPMKNMNSQLMSQLLAGVTQQQGMAQSSFNAGQGFLTGGMAGMDQGMKHYSDILGGKADKALAGPISDLTTGHSRAMQNTAQFGARGGTSAGLMSNRGPQLAGQIARLKTDSLDNAGKTLISAGGAKAGIGSNLMSGGMSSFGNSLSTLLGARGQDMQQLLAKMGIDAENKRALGEGIGSLMGILLGPGGMFNKDGD